MVFGWFGSGPRPSRPSRSEGPESQERPTLAHFGACSARSKTAVWSAPPPAPVTVTDMLAVRTSDPLVPRAWKG